MQNYINVNTVSRETLIMTIKIKIAMLKEWNKFHVKHVEINKCVENNKKNVFCTKKGAELAKLCR